MQEEVRVYEKSDVQVSVIFSDDWQRVAGTFTCMGQLSQRRIIGIIRLWRRQDTSEAWAYSGESIAYYAFPDSERRVNSMQIRCHLVFEENLTQINSILWDYPPFEEGVGGVKPEDDFEWDLPHQTTLSSPVGG